MNEDRSKRIQIVFRRKPYPTVFLRAMPCTARNPTTNQIKARVAFGEAAKKAKGVRYKGKKVDIPPAAQAVKESMKGKRFGRTEKLPKWATILWDVAKEEGLSKEEFSRLYGEIVRYTRRHSGENQEIRIRAQR